MKQRAVKAGRALNDAVTKRLKHLPNKLPEMLNMPHDNEDAITRFFFSRYELVVAVTNEERDISYKTRHKVYCEEMKFERENENAVEIDQYDERAVTCFIRHLPTGECAGTIRLVLPTERGLSLPLEKICGDAIENSSLLPSNLHPASVCEISRLAIPKDFRLRQMRTKIRTPFNTASYSEGAVTLEHFPYLSTALYLMVTSVCVHLNINHAYVLMEPKLARKMRTFGINFRSVGREIEHNGVRKPYRLSRDTMLRELSKPLRRFQSDIDARLSDTLQSIDAACIIPSKISRKVANAA